MYVTLSISTTSIRLLSAKGKRVKKWGSMPLSPGLVRDGLVLKPEAVGAAINALFESAKISKKRVVTSLTGLPFTYRILSLPRLQSDFVEEAIQRGARKEMPLPLEDLYLSWQAIGGGHDELDFFVLGVPRHPIDALIQALAEAKVKPYIVDLNPLALIRAANQGDALIVALEPDCFDIVLVTNGIPAIMHTVTPRGEGATTEDNIRQLIDELTKTVKFYNSNHPENPLSPNTPLLLTGELSVDAITSKLIPAEVEYPVELLKPPLAFPPDLPVALYATNLGLVRKKAALKVALKESASGFSSINLNILPDKYRGKAHLALMRYVLFALVVVIAIGPLFPMYQVKNQAEAQVARLQSELDRVGQELRQAHLAVNEVKQTEKTINEITANAETWEQEYQGILGKRGNFAHNLKLTDDTLPSGAYFMSMGIGTDQITVEGEADSWLTVINYAIALEREGRFSEVRIVKINEGKSTEAESVGVSFTIAITR